MTLPQPFLHAVIKRAGPEVMREGKLPLVLTDCRRLYTSPSQHSGADPEGEGTGEPTLNIGELESWRAGSALYRLQHVGEGVLHLDWADSGGVDAAEPSPRA